MKEEWSNPPKWADRMLGWFCSEEHLDILLGDLYELYEYRFEQKGKFRARLHYAKDAFDMLRPFAFKKRRSKYKTNNITMFRNYIKIGWRNMLRYKAYSTINVAGLALGLACCIILYRYVKDELSYDAFHEKGNEIHRVVFSTDDDKTPTNANGAFGPGPAIANDFPQVENFTRFKMIGQGAKIVMGYKDKRFYESRFFFADSTVFDVFTFPLLRGNPRTALTRPNTIVLTESMVEKYFGNVDPMGAFIKADPYNDGKPIDFMVTGVVEDVPSNSHMHFDFLASFHSQRGKLDNWFGFQQIFTYVLLNKGVDAQALDKELAEFSPKYMGENAWFSLRLQPLLDIHLKSALKSEIEPTSSITKVYIFSAVGALILLIACINFLTLSTAKSARRAKEVGVRKTFGAYRAQLFGQFISEAMLHGVIATLIAIGIVSLSLPAVNALTDKELSLVMDGQWLELIIIVLSAILAVALMAGAYPAIFLSSFKPITALRNKINGQGSIGRLRKGLVVFQFTISIALIVGSLIVSKQMNLVRQRSLAASGDQVMVLPLNNDLRKDINAFSDQLGQIASVKHYSGVSRVPTRGSNTNCFDLTEEVRGCAYIYLADFGYPEAMDYKLLGGRYFDPAITSDAQGAYIINRSALDEFELGTPEEAIGKKFGDEGFENGRIIGVVEDFHVYSLHRAYKPAYMLVAPGQYHNYMAISVSGGEMSQTIGQINAAWDEFSTEAPFDYFFLNEAFQRMHLEDIRTGQVISVLTLLAIIIAATGLFGLASFMSEQRAKEIGIRKVLGAGVFSLLTLMSKSYFKLILVAIVIGIPISFWLMTKWLNAFVYQVEFSPVVFVVAILMVGLIVTLSIGYQSLRAAMANPVKSLKDE